MLKAMEHCHKNDIVHRDVKMENFLIDYEEDGTLAVKIADFGLACFFEDE